MERKNFGLPRWIFILKLAALGRLNTRDRLFKWGVTTQQQCALCELENESINHLLFAWTISTQVWQKLLIWIDINRGTMGWNEELLWAEAYAKGRSHKAEIYRMMLAAGIYILWRERNSGIFQNKKQSTTMMIKQVVHEIHIKAGKVAKLRGWLTDHNFYP